MMLLNPDFHRTDITFVSNRHNKLNGKNVGLNLIVQVDRANANEWIRPMKNSKNLERNLLVAIGTPLAKVFPIVDKPVESTDNHF